MQWLILVIYPLIKHLSGKMKLSFLIISAFRYTFIKNSFILRRPKLATDSYGKIKQTDCNNPSIAAGCIKSKALMECIVMWQQHLDKTKQMCESNKCIDKIFIVHYIFHVCCIITHSPRCVMSITAYG